MNWTEALIVPVSGEQSSSGKLAGCGKTGMPESNLKAFEQPDELREFPFGRFELVQIAGVALGV
jgi:hypothetical protein